MKQVIAAWNATRDNRHAQVGRDAGGRKNRKVRETP